ncbi:MAG: MogA/MoaB family molybdenum cofactor biosynthesis protein [Pseudoclavibacter sp.]
MRPHDEARPVAAVITVSDRSSMGLRADTTGPVIVEALREAGYEVGDAKIVPDGSLPVRDAVRAAHDAGARLILTTGGTGIGPRDRTPEGIEPLLDLKLPRLIDAIVHHENAPHTSLLTRGVAGIIGGDTAAYRTMMHGPSLVVTLPGSLGGVRDGLDVVLSVARHAIAQLDGGGHEGHEAAQPAPVSHSHESPQGHSSHRHDAEPRGAHARGLPGHGSGRADDAHPADRRDPTA